MYGEREREQGEIGASVCLCDKRRLDEKKMSLSL